MDKNIDIRSLSKQKRMEFIEALNNHMKNYENNIENSIARSDKSEWNVLKDDKTRRVKSTDYYIKKEHGGEWIK